MNTYSNKIFESYADGKWSVSRTSDYSILFKGHNGVSVYTRVDDFSQEKIKKIIAILEERKHWCMSDEEAKGI